MTTQQLNNFELSFEPQPIAEKKKSPAGLYVSGFFIVVTLIVLRVYADAISKSLNGIANAIPGWAMLFVPLGLLGIAYLIWKY